MGIYPEYSTKDKQQYHDSVTVSKLSYNESWTEVKEVPGVKYERKVYATEWVEHRTDCYCCSCGEREGSDPYCRNHGWAATRPCDVHNMPGQTNEEGVMPDSVQKWREAHSG